MIVGPIEKSISMPAGYGRRPGKYGFSEFTEVGDSKLVLVGDGWPPEVRQLVASAAFTWKKNNEPTWKFKTRISEQGVRVWRVK